MTRRCTRDCTACGSVRRVGAGPIPLRGEADRLHAAFASTEDLLTRTLGDRAPEPSHHTRVFKAGDGHWHWVCTRCGAGGFSKHWHWTYRFAWSHAAVYDTPKA